MRRLRVMKFAFPTGLSDLLIPVTVVFAAFLVTDALQDHGFIASVRRELLGAIIGSVICWAVATYLAYLASRRERRDSG